MNEFVHMADKIVSFLDKTGLSPFQWSPPSFPSLFPFISQGRTLFHKSNFSG